MKNYNCIAVLGPTASGKTRMACSLAYYLNGEVISADSRQVYKQLDIGTGKDLDEYVVNGTKIPYHLLDLVEPGEQFYLHQFIQELQKAFNDIVLRHRLPIICGGTGLYLDALRKDFSYTQVKENELLRSTLDNLPNEELIERIKAFPPALTKHVDLNSKKRMIRGIEIAEYLLSNSIQPQDSALPYKPYYVGIESDIDTRKKLISDRLQKRIDGGLIDEVKGLLAKGITHERLEFLGLEYKFVSRYLQQQISKEELFTLLQTAIFQYAKRQMTWFRKMEKEGVKINWVKRDEIKTLVGQLKEIFE